MVRTLTAIVATMALATACSGSSGGSSGSDTAGTTTDDPSFLEDGADANGVETDAQLLVSSLVSSIESKTFGEGVRAVYLPRACLDVKNEPAKSTATYVFDGCVGPNGLRAVSGTIAVKYAVSSAGAVRLDVEAKGTKLNGATFDLATTATVSGTGSGRTMAWKAELTGTTGGGRAFTRKSDFTIGWQLGEPCFSLDGSSEGTVKARELKIEVDSYQRCKRGCPEAGGVVTITNVTKKRSVTIRYDGSNEATYTNAKGVDTALPLLCVP